MEQEIELGELAIAREQLYKRVSDRKPKKKGKRIRKGVVSVERRGGDQRCG